MSKAWSVPVLWPDSTVYIIGGGPSLRQEDLTPLHSPSRRVIGVNDAYQLGSWVDICWFGDCQFYLHHQGGLAHFGGLKVTCCPQFGKKQQKSTVSYTGAKYVTMNYGKKQGITSVQECPRKNKISFNCNSGYSAINLAYYLGARRVILLGFDMCRAEDGANHWHPEPDYGVKRNPRVRKREQDAGLPYSRFLACTPAIARDAEQLGLEIINCSMQSAIPERYFRKMPFEEVIRRYG